ncbi:DUF6270 domain-containing protein [Staphylococcus caeli]|uniref:DUF6270 domain-containing protein n=1 Tax=Staphylococcus caeli TaxID=2201815 RepID=UPI003F54CAB4
MISNISIVNNKIIFEDITDSKDIEYSFFDGIGEFSKKYSLDLFNFNNTIQLDLLKAFGKGINSRVKIIFNVSVNSEIMVYLSKINPFYEIYIHTENNQLVIELMDKNNLLNQNVINNKIIFKDSENIEVVLRKMISVDTKYYSNEILLNKNENYVLCDEIIKKIKKVGIRNQVWKLFVKLNDNNRNELYIEVDLKILYCNNKLEFEEKNIFYNNNYNSLVFDGLLNEKEMVVCDIQDSDENITVMFNRLNKEFKLFITLRNRQGNPFDFQQVKIFTPIQNKVIIPKRILYQIWLKEGDNLELLIGDEFNTAKFIEFDKNVIKKYRYFTLNNELSYKIYKNGRGTISIYIKEVAKNVSDKAIKIAVLGTCFSRNAFNSSDFFNPNYKKYFDCVYTQFHSTIGSLISTPAPNKCVELYEKSSDFRYIKTDMNKTFFEDLKLVKPDFLIIDLYADAMLQELVLENNSIITYNYMIKNETQLGDFVARWQNKYKNEEEYVNNWKANINIFMEKLSDIIPVEKIILNRGRLAEKYYDRDGILNEFITNDLIKRNNYYWEKLDNLFITEYPNISCIDLTGEDFYSEMDYPFGFSFSHYESNYYKFYLNELMKIVF